MHVLVWNAAAGLSTTASHEGILALWPHSTVKWGAKLLCRPLLSSSSHFDESYMSISTTHTSIKPSRTHLQAQDHTRSYYMNEALCRSNRQGCKHIRAGNPLAQSLRYHAI